MIYDDVLDVTWLQDANYADSSGFSAQSGFSSGGIMTWTVAKAWVTSLNYGGFDDWRLPKIDETDAVSDSARHGFSCKIYFAGSTCQTGNSELAYMIHGNLGNGIGRWSNVSFTDDVTGKTVNFENLYEFDYWLDDEYRFNYPQHWYASSAYSFNTYFTNTSQSVKNKESYAYAWAVRDGDVLANVSAPATLSLFSCAFLVFIRNRRTDKQKSSWK